MYGPMDDAQAFPYKKGDKADEARALSAAKQHWAKVCAELGQEVPARLK